MQKDNDFFRSRNYWWQIPKTKNKMKNIILHCEARKLRNGTPNPKAPSSEWWKSLIKLIPYNHKIDQFNFKSWPNPWSLLVENKFDELNEQVNPSTY